MERTERYEVEDLIREAGGQRATCRRSGVAAETIRTGRRGIRRWSPETRAKLARAWGVEVSEVRWPTEEPPVQGVYVVPPRREAPKVDPDDLYEDEKFKAAVEREVRRQMEAMDRTAAQSEPTGDR